MLLAELGELVADRAAHADRGVLAVAVVLVDPGCHSLAGFGSGGEALQAAQLELQRRVPLFDHRVIEGLTG